MNIQQIRKKTEMSQSEFAAYFDIPKKTIQKWEQNGSVPPDYIPKMIERILDLENKLLEKKVRGEVTSPLKHEKGI